MIAKIITSEAFDSVVCLVCGSAPKIVYTDGNTKVWLVCYIFKKYIVKISLQMGSLASGEHNLSVRSDFPPSGFSYIATDKAPPGTTEIKLIDNKKCVFTVDLKAIGSVHAMLKMQIFYYSCLNLLDCSLRGLCTMH